MDDVPRPPGPKPWLKGSPFDTALLFLCAPVLALAVWYEKTALMSLATAAWLGIPAAISLWRHREGIEAHPRPGLLWGVLVCSFASYLLGLLMLIPGG